MESFKIFGERPSCPVDFFTSIFDKQAVVVSEFISVNEKFSGLSLLLIVAMLGWSMKSSSERFKTDSGILGFTKDSFSVAQGLDATFPLSSRKKSLRLSPLELLFGRSGL